MYLFRLRRTRLDRVTKHRDVGQECQREETSARHTAPVQSLRPSGCLPLTDRDQGDTDLNR